MAAKLVVTARKGGSQIALIGNSGTELLASKVFTEPRAKGATLRSLKALLGEGVEVEDSTITRAAVKAVAATPDPAPAPAPVKKGSTKPVVAKKATATNGKAKSPAKKARRPRAAAAAK